MRMIRAVLNPGADAIFVRWTTPPYNQRRLARDQLASYDRPQGHEPCGVPIPCSGAMLLGQSPMRLGSDTTIMQTSQSPASKDCASRKYVRPHRSIFREGVRTDAQAIATPEGSSAASRARRRASAAPAFGRRSFVVGAALTIAASVGTAALAADLTPTRYARCWRLIAGPAAPDLSNRNLAGLDLSGVDFKGANLTGANLKKANLAGADLSNAIIDLAILRGANLRGAKLRNAKAFSTILADADLTGADLSGAKLVCNLENAKLVGRQSGGRRGRRRHAQSIDGPHAPVALQRRPDECQSRRRRSVLGAAGIRGIRQRRPQRRQPHAGAGRRGRFLGRRSHRRELHECRHPERPLHRRQGHRHDHRARLDPAQEHRPGSTSAA